MIYVCFVRFFFRYAVTFAFERSYSFCWISFSMRWSSVSHTHLNMNPLSLSLSVAVFLFPLCVLFQNQLMIMSRSPQVCLYSVFRVFTFPSNAMLRFRSITNSITGATFSNLSNYGVISELHTSTLIYISIPLHIEYNIETVASM